jgi:hypothetical protein
MKFGGKNPIVRFHRVSTKLFQRRRFCPQYPIVRFVFQLYLIRYVRRRNSDLIVESTAAYGRHEFVFNLWRNDLVLVLRFITVMCGYMSLFESIFALFCLHILALFFFVYIVLSLKYEDEELQEFKRVKNLRIEDL